MKQPSRPEQLVRSCRDGFVAVHREFTPRSPHESGTHKAGTISGLDATVGATVTAGAVLCEIKD